MSGLLELLRMIFIGGQPTQPASRPAARATPVSHSTGEQARPSSRTTAARSRRAGAAARQTGKATASAESRVSVLPDRVDRPAVPYWQLRGWRRAGDCVYLGYFKTRLGRRHGVIKWRSAYDFGFYVHDVPDSILDGPHGLCFEMVKPGKYRVHFEQIPADLNSAIFYIETLLQEAFEHGDSV